MGDEDLNVSNFCHLDANELINFFSDCFVMEVVFSQVYDPNHCSQCSVELLGSPKDSKFYCDSCDGPTLATDVDSDFGLDFLSSNNNSSVIYCDDCIAIHVKQGHRVRNGEGCEVARCSQHKLACWDVCETCQIVVCLKCFRQQHSSHDVKSIRQKAKDVQAKVGAATENCEKLGLALARSKQASQKCLNDVQQIAEACSVGNITSEIRNDVEMALSEADEALKQVTEDCNSKVAFYNEQIRRIEKSCVDLDAVRGPIVQLASEPIPQDKLYEAEANFNKFEALFGGFESTRSAELSPVSADTRPSEMKANKRKLKECIQQAVQEFISKCKCPRLELPVVVEERNEEPLAEEHPELLVLLKDFCCETDDDALTLLTGVCPYAVCFGYILGKKGKSTSTAKLQFFSPGLEMIEDVEIVVNKASFKLFSTSGGIVVRTHKQRFVAYIPQTGSGKLVEVVPPWKSEMQALKGFMCCQNAFVAFNSKQCDDNKWRLNFDKPLSTFVNIPESEHCFVSKVSLGVSAPDKLPSHVTHVYKNESVINNICLSADSMAYEVASVKPSVIEHVDDACLSTSDGTERPSLRCFCWSLKEKTLVLFEANLAEELQEQNEEKYIKFDIGDNLKSINVVNETCFIVTENAAVYSQVNFISQMQVKIKE